jgi:uncharacterized protein YcbK (DUF882 family)
MRNFLQIIYSPFYLACLLIGLVSATHAEEQNNLEIMDSSLPTDQIRKKPKRSAPKKRRRRGCSTYASQRYRKMVRHWRTPPKIPGPKYRDGFRDLTLYSVNQGERIRFFPYLSDGILDETYMNEIQHLFRDKYTDAEHVIHPRLIKLLYKIADRFDVKQINIISGYRESPGEVGESKHAKGQAVDFMIPGVSLAAVARVARSFGHVGVGFYPVSGFVHMDVREGPSYFWVDRSGPGKPSCTRRILSTAAAKFDRKYRARNDAPKRHKNRRGEWLGKTPPPPMDADLEEATHEAFHIIGESSKATAEIYSDLSN